MVVVRKTLFLVKHCVLVGTLTHSSGSILSVFLPPENHVDGIISY